MIHVIEVTSTFLKLLGTSPIHANHGHHAARDVLVTARDGDQGIIELGSHDLRPAGHGGADPGRSLGTNRWAFLDLFGTNVPVLRWQCVKTLYPW